MSIPEILNDRSQEIHANQSIKFAGKKVKVTSENNRVSSMNAALTRMSSRTEDEILSARKRILDLTPPPREIPENKTIFDMIMGK